MDKLSTVDSAALYHLREPITCTELGERLWPGRRRSVRQSFARPAGKIIQRLVRAGLVKRDWRGDQAHCRYVAIPGAIAKLPPSAV